MIQTRRCQCFIKHPEICVKFWSSNYEFVWRVNFQTPFLGSFLQLTWMNEVWNLSPLPLQWTFLLHPFFTPPYLLIQYRFCDHICQYWWTFLCPYFCFAQGGVKGMFTVFIHIKIIQKSVWNPGPPIMNFNEGWIFRPPYIINF